MKKLLASIVLGVVMALGGCSSSPMKEYKGTTPDIAFEEFFSGNIKGWGLVQNRSGKVIRRFDVDMKGTWEGDTGTLEEIFTYYDGETQKRVWHIKKLGEGRYEGRADDILGKATGETAGSAARWKYSMDLPVGNTTYKITFDDWMFRMNDGIVVNRSYLKKFGVTVAELTLFMQKQEPK
ncbi:MAG: DUF3833 domain-containing protein [Alphaproteobacteria bacterium]|nr:DUF3833 domain-containing protein [Alphaproteobacteria bacterium]